MHIEGVGGSPVPVPPVAGPSAPGAPGAPVNIQFAVEALAAAAAIEAGDNGQIGILDPTKNAALDPIALATDKVVVNIQVQQQQADAGRKVELEHLKTIVRKQSERVHERAKKQSTRHVVLNNAMLGMFSDFVHTIGSAFVANGYGVARLQVDAGCGTLAVLVSDPARPDFITFLLWEDGPSSKIAVLVDRTDGSIGEQLEVLPPFDEEKAQAVAEQLIASLKL